MEDLSDIANAKKTTNNTMYRKVYMQKGKVNHLTRKTKSNFSWAEVVILLWNLSFSLMIDGMGFKPYFTHCDNYK